MVLSVCPKARSNAIIYTDEGNKLLSTASRIVVQDCDDINADNLRIHYAHEFDKMRCSQYFSWLQIEEID